MMLQMLPGEHILMAVKDIIVVPGLNPPVRTEDVRELEKSIRTHGILVDLVITTERYLVDGHRRLLCAQNAGIETVPCRVLDGTPRALWVELNGYTRAPRGQDWAHMASLGIAPARGTAAYNYVRLLREVGGDELLQALAQNRMSVSIWQSGAKIWGMAQRTDVEFRRKTLYWLLKYKAQRYSRNMLEAGTPVEVLVYAIEADKPVYQS